MKYRLNQSSQKQAQPFLIQICYSPMAIYTHVFKNTNRFLPPEKDKSIPKSPAYITCRAGSYQEPLQTPNYKTWNILAQARQTLPNNRTHSRTEDINQDTRMIIITTTMIMTMRIILKMTT